MSARKGFLSLSAETLSDEFYNEADYLAALEAEDYYNAENDFRHYLRCAWEVLEPQTVYLHNWHIDCISDYLMAVHGGDLKKLIINMPPRYMKSIAVTVCFPTWIWINNPAKRMMFASYAESLSVKHSLDRRALVKSDWYQRAWGDRYKLSDDQDTKKKFSNNKRGHMIATSVGGAATGEGGNLLITDDPVDPRRADSKTKREDANNWYDKTFVSRKDDKKNAAEIVVMQRLHHADLSQHLKDKGGWEVLELQAEATKKTVIYYPHSGEIKTREVGDIIWPSREGKPELEQTKRDLGTAAFSAQYQQQPTPEGGAIIKKEWFRFYDKPPGHGSEIVQSWDMAFKDSSASDYVVGGVWSVHGIDFYLLDIIRKQMGFVDTLKAFKTMHDKWPSTSRTLIEDKANGPGIIDSVKNTINGVIAVSPDRSKEERVATASPTIESGHIYLPSPEKYQWVADFIDECARFPKGDNDDQVDMMTQIINYFNQKAVGDFSEEMTQTTATIAGGLEDQGW